MKNFIIIFTEHIPLIDFSEVMETNETTLRKNNANTSTFVKWVGETPPSIQNLIDTYNYEIYTYEEILEELISERWVDLSECDGCPCTEYYKSEGMEI